MHLVLSGPHLSFYLCLLHDSTYYKLLEYSILRHNSCNFVSEICGFVVVSMPLFTKWWIVT